MSAHLRRKPPLVESGSTHGQLGAVLSLDAWHLVDLHRYYFFQGLSTTGALLLLAQYGPGELAVQEDEVLLGDVELARD